MSLDLSHNDITDLPAVLSQLQQLNALRSLSLKGNPASLAAGYRQAVLQALPQLLYLDGQVGLQESTSSCSSIGIGSGSGSGSTACCRAACVMVVVVPAAVQQCAAPAVLFIMLHPNLCQMEG